MRKINLRNVALSLTIICLSVLIFCGFYSRPKLAYVNTYMIYNDFKLKKELEEKLKKTQLTRKVLLDSMRVKIQMVMLNVQSGHEKLTDEQIAKLREAYFLKERQYQEDNDNQAQTYTDQVWKQLNEYIAQFGKEKGYDYIIGANGQGNLMYARENNDISKQLIEYVNAKYEGK